MFKIKYEYSGKIFYISPYTTLQEKDLLLMDSFDNKDVDIALEILGIEKDIIVTLSNNEKIALLYKFREISIGSEIPIKFKCPHCEIPNELTISIEKLIENSNIKNDYVIDQYKTLTRENFQEFLNIDVDELEFDEYDIIFKEVKESITKFNFLRPCNCLGCKRVNYIDISKNVIEHLSEDSLIGLYQNYSDLVFFGKYTKQDIDSLYPFERSIVIGLLNKTREELSK